MSLNLCAAAKETRMRSFISRAALRLGFGLCLALPSLTAKAAILLANPDTHPDSVAGQWDMSLGQTNRKCRMTLRAEKVDAAHGIGMPAGCRRAMPILAGVSTWVVNNWTVNDARHLALVDAAGRSVLDFTAGAGDTMTANGPNGEIYQLVAVEQSATTSSAFQSIDANRAPGFAAIQTNTVQTAPLQTTPLQTAPVQIAAASAASEVAAARPRDLAGRYAILRDGGKDTGCMLTLDDRSHGRGGNRAALAPACRDQGIVIFDPVAWQIVGGRLVLTARKGHTTHLDWQQNGTWLKDPKEGKGLALKKM